VVLALHREALAGISIFAGNFRPAGVKIEGSKHEPVGAHLVPERVEDMCDYVNSRWDESTPLHLAAYIMWRLNWIHPVADGNGRTSRILSYVVLSIRAGAVLPGTPTIPDQIVDNRNPYFEALDAADVAWREGRVDVSKMEELVGSLLARQLANFYETVGGKLQ
jgi:Fic family protein